MKFETLAVAALAWLSLNALAGGRRLRQLLAARFGDRVCESGFSFAKTAGLWWLVREYGRAPFVVLWHAGPALKLVPVVVVPLAFMFFAQALLGPRDQDAGDIDELPRGLRRVTRQPFSLAVALWAGSHQIVSGDVGSQLFFGTLVLTALYGIRAPSRPRPSTQDAAERAEIRSPAARAPRPASRPARARSLFREIWLSVLLGLAFTIVAVAVHARMFGAPAVP